MIEVLAIGDTRETLNPATGKWSMMTNIRFIEKGRATSSSMAQSSAALSEAIGETVGLDLLRTHTHPVLAEKAHLFPVGKTLNLFINRTMFSEPQITQQEGVLSRMVDGKATYFLTEISKVPLDDVDKREDEALVLANDPFAHQNARRSGTIVRTIESRPFPGTPGYAPPAGDVHGETSGTSEPDKAQNQPATENALVAESAGLGRVAS